MVQNYGNVSVNGDFGETREYRFSRGENQRRGARVLEMAGAGLKEAMGAFKDKVAERREKKERGKRLVLGVGEVEKSKGMTYEDGAPTVCEDASFVDEGQAIFGVFDGVGGERGGRRASQMAVEGLRHFAMTRELKTTGELAEVLEKISGVISRDKEAGATTATVAKITREKGRKYLNYVQAGDSRIYVVRGRDAYQVTRDEGVGHQIDNWLGERAPGVSQMGKFPLMNGDRIVLCTDGVTGDYGDERMSNYEIAEIVNRGVEVGSPQVAARILVEEARKHDDRTAIVVEV